MAGPPASQAAPLPSDLPFRLVSRTIGTGAYAFIRKAAPKGQPSPIIAIKFINKSHAFTHGRLSPSTLATEIKLHKYLRKHKNIIEFYGSSDESKIADVGDPYIWIAMELASNGDLFDKIEADVGVGEDIAHLYFRQLMGAVGYMHSMGVAHRDLKPENILVGDNGDLKLADFGLAALFKRGDQIRTCNTVCGSPPYIAPEVVTGKRGKRQDVLVEGYLPNVADVWSAGVILFTLLVGNTPWDEPTTRSYEFEQYVQSGGKMGDELWQQLPKDVLSLLRGMMKLDPRERFSLEEVRTHPWMTRTNPMVDSKGRVRDQLALATQMMENLRVDFHPSSSQRYSQRASTGDAMDIDSQEKPDPLRMSATQPETPMGEHAFDWELPQTQPTRSRASAGTQLPHSLVDRLMEDLALSQFTQQPQVPLSLTQAARRFGDIVPATPMTQFLSTLPPQLLISTVVEALHKLGVPSSPPLETVDAVYIRIKTKDNRGQALVGQAILSQWNSDVLEVRFMKSKGDPLEWRRFFKNVCVWCKDAIVRPDQQ